MEVEHWKTIPGFDQYEVSDLGHVRRKSRKNKLLSIDYRGRTPAVQLGFTRRSLPYLVLNAFENHGSRYMNEIAYRDGNTLNCRLSNLYWRSRIEIPEPLPKLEPLDTEAIIILWKAILDQAIKDLYYGEHPRGNGDKFWGTDAKEFFRKAYWMYLGEEPDRVTMKIIATRVASFKPPKRGRRKNEAQKTVPEMQVPLDRYGYEGPKGDFFRGARLLRVYPEDRKDETMLF